MKQIYLRLLILSFFSFVRVSYGQSGNRVHSNSEVVNFSSVSFSTSNNWFTDRSSSPGFYTFLGTAISLDASSSNHVNGYIKHIATSVNQPFGFHVGSGTSLRTLSVSGNRADGSTIAVTWIEGNPSTTIDPTAPHSGIHPVSSFDGIDLIEVSTAGQWDWIDFTGNAAGLTVEVSLPDLTGFGVAADLRLVGWNGIRWVNLSGNTGASGNTEGSLLSGTMAAGITALGIGRSCGGCIVYRTKMAGNFSNAAIWEVQHCDGSWRDAGAVPTEGSAIQVAHELVLNQSFNINNCPLTLLDNGVSRLVIAPRITLGFKGGSDGNAYFNNRPVVVASDASGSGAIGAMTALSKTVGDGNVTVERYFHNHGNRRWALLTIPVRNSTVWPQLTIRDAWAGGNRPRVSASYNRNGSTVWAYGPAPGKPANRPFPLNITDPLAPGYNELLYKPGDGTIITGHRYVNPVASVSDGFDWWEELIIPRGATYYTSPTTTAIATTTFASNASIRPYRPNLAGDPWQSGTHINTGFAGRGLVNTPLNNAEQGYMLFIRGDRNVLENGSGATTLRPTGEIRKFEVAVPVPAGSIQRFTVIGNPYAAPISFDKVLNNASNAGGIKSGLVVWDNQLTGSANAGAWRTATRLPDGSWVYAPSALSGTNPHIVSSGQAVLVEGTTGGSLIIDESMKTDAAEGNDLIQPFEVQSSGFMGINLDIHRLEQDGRTFLVDGAAIVLDDRYSSSTGDANDVAKIMNVDAGLQVSVQRGTSNLAIEATAVPKSAEVFRLHTPRLASRSYRFSFKLHNLGMDKMSVMLHDKALGRLIPLNEAEFANYDFSGVGGDTMRHEYRFELIVKPNELLPIQFVSIRATGKEKSNEVSWQVADEAEVTAYRIEYSTTGNGFSAIGQVKRNDALSGRYSYIHEGVAAGNHYYRIYAIKQDGAGYYSGVVRVHQRSSGAGSIAVYPNIISTEAQVNIRLSNMTAGQYTVKVTDAAGRMVKTMRLDHGGTDSVYALSTEGMLQKGMYMILVEGMSSAFAEKLLVK